MRVSAAWDWHTKPQAIVGGARIQCRGFIIALHTLTVPYRTLNLHMSRLSTGIAALDELLDGGLLPGRLTVVVGATGIGKTQLGCNSRTPEDRRKANPVSCSI